MNKSLYLIALLLIYSLVGMAQQLPQYSMYNNAFLYNPAIAGINNYLDIKASVRQQYSGVQNGPTTAYISAHKAINQADLNKKELESLPMRGVTPVRFKVSDQQKVRHGLGGYAFNDQAGLLNRTSANVAYSVHIPSGRSFYLGMGGGVGFSSIQMAESQIRVQNNQVNELEDAAIMDAQSAFVFPEARIGIWAYTPKYFVGLSALQLVPANMRFTDAEDGMDIEDATLKNHLVLNGGYRIQVADDVNLVPNMMMKYVLGIAPIIEGGVRATYQENIWGGVMYRFADFTHVNSESMAVQLGLNINNLLEIGFSYDYNLFELNTQSNGSFELVMGLRLLNKRNANSRLF